MTTNSGRRLGSVLPLAAVVALVAAIAVSPFTGRAHPVGSYRPELPPDALTNGCWPLPGGARLDFGYQVRTDELVPTADGVVRRLVLHYDRLSAEQVRRRIAAAFEQVGADPVEPRVTPFAGTGPADLVRGTAVLDLPPTSPDPTRAICRSPYVTKRFPPDLPTSAELSGRDAS